jgi:hypothetical protein
LIHVRNIGLVLALAALIVWRVRRTPVRMAGYAAGLAAMGAIKIAINLRFWGTPLTNPHEHLGDWPGLAAFFSQSATSLAGLLLDARHGLILAAPIFSAGTGRVDPAQAPVAHDGVRVAHPSGRVSGVRD